MRRVEVTISFFVSFHRDTSYAEVTKMARDYLIQHASTIPMLFREVEALDIHTHVQTDKQPDTQPPKPST